MPSSKNPMRRSWLGEGQSEGWVAHRLELKVSPAWRHRPAPLMRLLERIEIEHLRHGGVENGNLIVTYDQFVEHRVSRRAINGLLQLGEVLGLLEVRQSGAWANDIRAPNTYRLTYLAEKGGRRAPTDEWEKVTNDAAELAVAQFQNGLRKKPTSQCPKPHTTSAHSCTKPTPTSAQNDKSPVPIWELTLISGGEPAKHTEAAQYVEVAPVHTGRVSRNVQAGDTIDDLSERTNKPVHVSDALRGILADTARSHHPKPSDAPSPVKLTDGERSLLRWLVGFDGKATHRTAQQNLSGSLKGDAIIEASENLAIAGLIRIEIKGRSRIYVLLDAGRNPALLHDPRQIDLVDWLEGAAH